MISQWRFTSLDALLHDDGCLRGDGEQVRLDAMDEFVAVNGRHGVRCERHGVLDEFRALDGYRGWHDGALDGFLGRDGDERARVLALAHRQASPDEDTI